MALSTAPAFFPAELMTQSVTFTRANISISFAELVRYRSPKAGSGENYHTEIIFFSNLSSKISTYRSWLVLFAAAEIIAPKSTKQANLLLLDLRYAAKFLQRTPVCQVPECSTNEASITVGST
jgi:hypothetical protein